MIFPIQPEAVVIEPVIFSPVQSVVVHVLRLDKIHPVVSGNKWFKLRYYLQSAIENRKKGLLTFGGAWSNHVVATAYAAKMSGLESKAIIRGDAHVPRSRMLQDAISFGMEIEFADRSYFRELSHDPAIRNRFPDDWELVPEGGKGPAGIEGASTILDLVPNPSAYTHIMCAAGTGTMLAGICNAATPRQQVIGISSLKGKDTLSPVLSTWCRENAAPFRLLFDYHFGGYARFTPDLIRFMNQLYQEQNLPTDLVYTSKLFYGLADLLASRYFPTGAKILVIHSGGLQGNRSLEPGQLIF